MDTDIWNMSEKELMEEVENLREEVAELKKLVENPSVVRSKYESRSDTGSTCGDCGYPVKNRMKLCQSCLAGMAQDL